MPPQDEQEMLSRSLLSRSEQSSRDERKLAECPFSSGEVFAVPLLSECPFLKPLVPGLVPLVGTPPQSRD